MEGEEDDAIAAMLIVGNRRWLFFVSIAALGIDAARRGILREEGAAVLRGAERRSIVSEELNGQQRDRANSRNEGDKIVRKKKSVSSRAFRAY